VWTAVPHGPPGELALMATLRAAAPEQPARRRRLTNPEHGPALLLEPDDLRARVRRGRPRRLVLFVVDASGSMGARDRMSATKGAVLSLLLDAYRKRDRVGMLAFRDTGAEVLLPPTNSVELAEERLHALPVGGRTPLAGGLRLAAAVIERARRSVDAEPLIVLISDVRPNMAPAGADPWRMALEAAAHIRAAGWEAIVIDTESGRAPLGLGRPLAAAMGAQHLKLDHLRAGHVEWAVRARFLD
jgi:magnesium chelatase subunit D